MKKELIYFGAEWCGPCKTIKPQLLAANLPIRFVDVDLSPQMASHHGIRNIPTIILVMNGEAVKRVVGESITVEVVKQLLN
jgi:thioredoxin-like negative regulator of GroEL